jgi:peptide/nickel transport system substrate-binding protein
MSPPVNLWPIDNVQDALMMFDKILNSHFGIPARSSILLVALSGFVAACGGPATQRETIPGPIDAPAESTAPESDVLQTTEEPQQQAIPAVLRFGIDAADLGTLDPHFAAARNDRAVVDMVFNGLLRYKPGNSPLIEPDLAVSIPEPEIVDGKQVWTFKLQSGIMCHPGPETEAYELEADDVIYSLQKAANGDRSAYAGEYADITVEKVDDYTVRFTLEQPLSSFLFLPKIVDYAGGFIVCKKAVEAMGDKAFSTHPVGTGPFRFDSYTPGENVRLMANEQYFRGQPLLEGVEVLYLPEFSDRDRGLRSGDLDVIFGSEETEWFEEIKQEQDIIVDVFGVGQVITAHFNTSVEPLDDVRIRKAIAYALDRGEFLDLFAEGVVANVYSPVPVQFLPGGLTKEEAETLELDHAVNLEKARQLMADASYADGFSLEVVTSERGHYASNYESLKSQLAEIGIEVKVEVVDHSTMHSIIREDKNPIVIYVAWRPNADVFLTRFFHSDSIVVTGAKPDTNFSHYDQIDDLIEGARNELDPGEQVSLWKQAQIKILDDMVAYPLHYINLVYAHRESVDFGNELVSTVALYPQITEETKIVK